MDASKKFIADHNILPQISFKDGAEHIVTLLADKTANFADKNGEEKEGMVYKCLENGQQVKFLTGSEGLIAKLSQLEPYTIVKIKMVKGKNAKGQFVNHFQVDIIGKQEGKTQVIPEKENEEEYEEPAEKEIPIIEDRGTDEEPSEEFLEATKGKPQP